MRQQPQAQPAHPLLGGYPRFPGVSPQLHTKLLELCGPRWVDLLFHLPSKVLDRSNTPTIATAQVGERATILARVLKRPPLPNPKFKRPYVIECSDDSGTIRCIFFNAQSWLERAFPVGELVILSGKIEDDPKGKKIIHPDVWSAGKRLEDIAKVWPLYPLTAGVSQGWMHRIMHNATTFLSQNPTPEWLPDNLIISNQLPSFSTALSALHNAQAETDLAPTTLARTRLALDELFATQLALIHARQTTRKQPGIAHGTHSQLTSKLIKSLPFPLTADQKQALTEIRDDLHTARPMLRLVQGDVGAGKTLVALIALTHVIESGHQGVLMAPTEILAQQHFETAKRYLEPLGITVGLLTGRLTAANKKKLKQSLQGGFINLLIGTHALVQDDVIFDKLGLAVVDEQHRFGVRQRVALSANQPLPPDMLVMTATPIPRTLALTAYGDMDTSIIREKPPGRTPIQTVALPMERLPEITQAIQRVIKSGQQIYWVCPLVEESEQSDLTAATERHAMLEKLYGAKVALLHGKMKGAEKEAAMAAFKRGETAILVSTTVIEVGVDVPNATVMVIEHAERFGLSQLHQLRGRVGRGSLASKCMLLYAMPLSGFAMERLNALRQSEDGFYLAEKDLELRGPGEVLGTRQSGEQSTRLADLYHHRDLIPVARQAAEDWFNSPPAAARRKATYILLELFNKATAADFLRGG